MSSSVKKMSLGLAVVTVILFTVLAFAIWMIKKVDCDATR